MDNSELKKRTDKIDDPAPLFSSDLKTGLDKVRVPEALLQSTMMKMHEENEALLKGKKERLTGEEYPEIDRYYNKKKNTLFGKRTFGMVFAVGLAAVAVSFFNRSASTLLWQNIQMADEPHYKAAESADMNVVSIEEFEEKTDIPVLPYMTLGGYSSYTCYVTDEMYEARLDYSREKNYVLILSPAEATASSAIDTSRYTEIEGQKVSLAKDEKEGMLACLWNNEQGSCYLYGFAEEKEFMNFLTEVLALQKDLK